MSTGVTLASFQHPMKAIVDRCQALDIRTYEVASADRIAEELRPTALRICDDARGVMGSVLEACEPAAASEVTDSDTSESIRQSYLPFERAIDATVATKLGSYAAASEIAFIAQLELRQRTERLERARVAHGAATLLGECDSTIRRVRKALAAVDASIAKVEGVKPLLDFTSELQTSLAVRRAYGKFRARLGTGDEVPVSSLRARFRAVGTQIAMLVGWDAYPDMRVRDRLLLRDLQQRVLDWLRDGESADNEAGLRILQDLNACVEMFALVNRRQELLEHDSRAVSDVTKRLFSQPDDELVDAEAWRVLRALEGLDAELDRVLAAAAPRAALLVPIVTRLAVQLGSAAQPPSTGAPGGADLPW